MPAARRLLLTLLTALGLALPASAAHAAVVAPTVSITSPAAGATATGAVPVNADGIVDPTEVATTTVALRVDGAQLGPDKPCDAPVGEHNCPVFFTWDSTGLNGAHVLEVVLHTPTASVTSSITVSAVNPPPTVSVTSPRADEVVKGPLTVTATGTVDPSQSDTVRFLQLWVDGAKYGTPLICDRVAAKTCTGSFTVVQPTWSGTHTVQVTLGTATTTATSATVPYLAYTGAKLFLSRVATVHAGRPAVVRGRVIAVTSGTPLVGTRVAVTLTPATGRKHTVVVRTGATGRFSLAARLAVNTGVTVNVLAAPGHGSSHGSLRAGVLAPIVCTADRTIRHGRIDAGTCTVAHLPDGTRLALQYRSGKSWITLGAGKNVGTSIPISFQFGRAGHYPVRLVLAASKAYVLTYGTPFVVTVT